MKVLISNDTEAAHLFDRVAWKKVFEAAGHTCVIWDIRRKSAFDAFYEVEPDLFVGQLHNIDRATFKCLQKYNTKVILKAGHWGSIDSVIDVNEYPVLVASDEHKDTARKLKEINKLDFVFVHYHPNRIESLMGSWNEICKPIGLMNACDTFSYLGGEVKEEFEADVAIVSGYWPYKAKNLNPYIFPLCQSKKYNIKIYGNSSWPVAQYVGFVNENNVKHIFKSTKINIDVHEPHYVFGFDVTERIFKVCGAGGFYLSGGYVESAHKDVFKNTIHHVVAPVAFPGAIDGLLERDEYRKESARELQKEVLESHTYFDRVIYALTELGLEEEASKIKEAKSKNV